MPTDLHAMMQNTRHRQRPSVDVQFWQCLSLSGEFQTSTKKKEVQDVIIIDPGSVELCRELRKDLCQA